MDTERIVPEFVDDWDEDLQSFINLFDETKWDVLMAKYADPDNKQTIDELVGELLRS